ncbi:MAG: MerR family transcriptional regulator [Chloroflexota bacterium]|jgi:DNA-binding transcriptional MerR regulator
MQQTRKTPTFNMKAVVQETGIRPDTLRAWERRYSLPNPDRTTGGHRIYSQRDVDTLKWLMARQEEGLSISHAVDLFNRLEEEGQDPLLASAYGSPVDSADQLTRIGAGDSINEMRDAWLTACRAFDEPAANRILAEAFALFPVEQVCVELLQKGMAMFGQGWYEGEATVQQEHFASALAMRQMDALLAASPKATRPGKVLLGCPPEEEHTFGLLLMAVLLRRRGLDAVYLGANVPTEQLALTIESVRPRLAIFLAQHLISAAELGQVGDFLADEQLPLAYGGRIFLENPSLRGRIEGHYLGDDLLGAASEAEKLVGRSERPTPVEPLPEEYGAALNHFISRRAALESALTTTLAVGGQAPDQFASAGEFLTRNVTAALKLGDIDLVTPEVEWIGGLLGKRQLDPELLIIYLAAYRQALIDTLDERGQIIIDWLDRLLERFRLQSQSA